MKLTEAKYKKVRVWAKQLIEKETYGCDECCKAIPEYPNEIGRLEVTAYSNPCGKSTSYHFCSWNCVLEFIQKVKCNYFFTLPYVSFDEKFPEERSGKRLVSLLKSK